MKDTKNSIHETFTRREALLNYLLDFVGILVPASLFINISLLVFGNILSIQFMEIMLWIMMPLILLFLTGFNIFLIYKYGGCCGNLALNLVTYDAEGHPASTSFMVKRECLEKGLPMILLYFILPYWGNILYVLFCVLFILIDRQHRSWVDHLLHTKPQRVMKQSVDHTIIIEI